MTTEEQSKRNKRLAWVLVGSSASCNRDGDGDGVTDASDLTAALKVDANAAEAAGDDFVALLGSSSTTAGAARKARSPTASSARSTSSPGTRAGPCATMR